jgi:hypothetical protein
LHVGFWWESQTGRDHYEDLNVGERNTTEVDLREIGWRGMDSIHLLQDRDEWSALVNAIMNIHAP